MLRMICARPMTARWLVSRGLQAAVYFQFEAFRHAVELSPLCSRARPCCPACSNSCTGARPLRMGAGGRRQPHATTRASSACRGGPAVGCSWRAAPRRPARAPCGSRAPSPCCTWSAAWRRACPGARRPGRLPLLSAPRSRPACLVPSARWPIRRSFTRPGSTGLGWGAPWPCSPPLSCGAVPRCTTQSLRRSPPRPWWPHTMQRVRALCRNRRCH